MPQTDDYYTKSINGFLLQALEKAWCKETAYPLCQDEYDEKHPSWGNCFVSSIVIWAEDNLPLVAGIVDMPSQKGIWHWRNTTADATWQQFDKGSVFYRPRFAAPSDAQYQEIVVESVFNDETLLPRLALLMDRMEKRGGYEMETSAQDIVAALRHHYRNYSGPQLSGPATPQA